MGVNGRASVSSGTKWEAMAGYSRAVRVGGTIYVSGTTATDENGALVGGTDTAAQTRYALQKIERAIVALGGTLRDVVRTRIFVSDITNWQAAAQVHGEFFEAIRPVTTLVEGKLVGPEYLIEIEAEAVVGSGD